MGNGLEGVGLKQGSQPEVIVLPRGCLAMSGGNVACYNLEVVPSIQHIEARDAATWLTRQRRNPSSPQKREVFIPK